MRSICSINGCERVVVGRGWCGKHYQRWQKHGSPEKLVRRTPAGAPSAWIEAHKEYTGSDCLIWPYARKETGYGCVTQGRRTEYVHRIMCEHKHGHPPSDGLLAAHECGNGHLGCVNPQHLSWKTYKENQADRARHGTLCLGENAPNAALTEDGVRRIRELVAEGVSRKKIASKFSIHEQTISSIVCGASWGWLS